MLSFVEHENSFIVPGLDATLLLKAELFTAAHGVLLHRAIHIHFFISLVQTKGCKIPTLHNHMSTAQQFPTLVYLTHMYVNVFQHIQVILFHHQKLPVSRRFFIESSCDCQATSVNPDQLVQNAQAGLDLHWLPVSKGWFSCHNARCMSCFMRKP